MHKGIMKKIVKSKVAAQKWLWWPDNGKKFNNNNSGEFWYRSTGDNTNSPELLLLQTCSYQTTTATFGLPPLTSQLFSFCLFCMGHTFFYSLAVFVQITFCSLIATIQLRKTCLSEQAFLIDSLECQAMLIEDVIIASKRCNDVLTSSRFIPDLMMFALMW